MPSMDGPGGMRRSRKCANPSARPAVRASRWSSTTSTRTVWWKDITKRPGRAGAGLTAFDYDRVKDLPPLPAEGAHSLDEMWGNAAYFLKAVVPVAEEAGVRLALHPNDPPAPDSRGSGQIMGTVEGWKRLVDIVPSPSNGITFDCGVTREMGQDPVEVCRYFGSRDCINHVHYRNVRVRVPYQKYTEVFLDEGEIDMFAVMRELVRQKYPRLIYPEHPRALDADRERPGFHPYYPGGGSYVGYAYNVGYARAHAAGGPDAYRAAMSCSSISCRKDSASA